MQPSLPNATNMQEKCSSCATISLQDYHQQINVLAGDETCNGNVVNMFDANVDIDILLFRCPSHDGTRELTRRVNPHNSCRCTKEICVDSFNRIYIFGLSKVIKVKSETKKMILVFEKMSLVEVGSNPLALEKFPDKINFEHYESCLM